MLTLRVVVPGRHREEVVHSLQSLVGPALAETACSACRVLSDAMSPDAITFEQAWRSEQDLMQHVRAHQFRVLVAVADLSEREPEIRLDGVALQTSGLELLELLRPARRDHKTPSFGE